MAKKAGATTEAPYIDVERQRVYIMWDVPHLIKSTRNMLKKHNAIFQDKIACFKDIVSLYNIDSKCNPRLVPRLNDKHVMLPPFSAMNVSLATRTLSQSVANGLRYYMQIGELSPQCINTAEFIEFYDKLFDTFNSKNNSSVKPLKQAMEDQSIHWDFLQHAKTTLANSNYTSNTCLDITEAVSGSKQLTTHQRHPNYIRGFISNINSIVSLWQELHNDYGAESLFTNYLCQDFLENMFSEVRRRCGGNDAPDAQQFGASFKYTIIESNINHSNGTNCEPDDLKPLMCFLR
ncbi:uncharacterized protein LOC129717317 [Wyeomyia smithii]|uniref:uncharacterized protein LOC129717317 n=1 Tax=Wyeomyia smithii TaxID=174621 RepID=UPI0024681292|nr:uncharacterized protein LOC129717317 [Wyeomyia smithii]